LDSYQKFIFTSRYARYLEDEGRRETWEEVVDRYISFFKARHDDKAIHKKLESARTAILNLEVMPSMRCLMTAGPALDRDNVAGFNCSYVPLDHPRAFDELLYILMCGSGVGFSVERQYIDKLPRVPEELHESETIIAVGDSKVGWARSLRTLLSMLWAGEVPRWDLSRIRPAGSRLRTFGGRASGPEPLEDLFRFSVALFQSAKGRRLSPLEAHDLGCKIAQIVVVGGVRRSALISLSNLSDNRMRHAKDGDFYTSNPQRTLANNSICYTEKPDFQSFYNEMHAMFTSFSGERGIFNRQAAEATVLKTGRRQGGHDWGCNPCSEIILRPGQFCNLTEVVVRSDDTLQSLKRKVDIATFLGTLQSSLTDFRYLRSKWKRNTEEEALLGVSLTGIMDHEILGNCMDSNLPKILEGLRKHAQLTNVQWADTIGVKESAAITCVKPSGTVSQLVNSASGIHARYAEYYIRRVRADEKDPLAQWMVAQGFPYEPDITNRNVLVFSFPVEAPAGAVVEDELRALEALELWKIYQDHWCEHKPSITVHYKEDEYFDICAWVWENFDRVSGISFLPKNEHVYQQAPYEQIDHATFVSLSESLPSVSFEDFRESEDNTTGSQELACSAGVCEIVDLT
jgi:ribonucleoside-diphosphate reductase alpha chain